VSVASARAAFVFDLLVLLASVAAVVIELSGGIQTSVAGIRISARSVDRAVFVALALLAIRLLIDRRSGLLRVDAHACRAWRDRLFQSRADSFEERSRSLSTRWGHAGAAVGGLCVAGTVLLWPQLRAMDSVPDLGDPLFSIWRIGWVYRQLLGDPRPLFDANIFHPEPLTLTYSDSMLLPAAMAAPLLAAGVHPVVSYNLLMLSGFLLSGAATYLLVERLTGSARAGFVSALIYGFYPYRFEHYSHLELQITYWMPLALLAVHRFLETLRFRDAALAASAVVLQLYSSMYYAIYFLIYGAAVFLVLAFGRQLPARRVVRPALASGVLALALAIPLARPYLAAQPLKGERDVPSVSAFSATAADYLRAHQRSALYGPHLLPGRKIERALFPGVMALVLTAVSLAPPIGLVRLAYGAGLLVAFDGSLGFNGLLYPYFYEWFLPIRGLRVPARFSVILGLSLAILSGFGVRRMLVRVPPRASSILFVVVVVAVIADLRPILALRPVWREPPPVYASLGAADRIVLAEFPLPGDPFGFGANTRYMYFSVWHGAGMVNGYSGFLPPSYEKLAETMSGFPTDAAIALLKARGVTHVTINCAFAHEECVQLLDILDGHRAFRRVSEGRWEGAPVVIYQLIR
jgi:hypothetical protein